MLNYFKVCPICNTNDFLLKDSNGLRSFCKEANHINENFKHFIYGKHRDGPNWIEYEQVEIEEFCLLFRKSGLHIYENKGQMNAYRFICQINNCSILFSSLDSADKINEVIRNYNILC